MFGCLRRVGCLAVLVLLAGAAYFTRHRWLPLVLPGRTTAVASATWTPVSRDGAQRARRAITRLNALGGPVFANIAAADLASYLLDSTSAGFTSGARAAEAAVADDRLLLRTELRATDLGVDNLPFFGRIRDKTVVVTIGGTLALARPGAGEWRVRSISLDAFDVPSPAIARVTRAIAVRLSLAGTRDDAVSFALPAHIADLRVNRGAVTLYKSPR